MKKARPEVKSLWVGNYRQKLQREQLKYAASLALTDQILEKTLASLAEQKRARRTKRV